MLCASPRRAIDPRRGETEPASSPVAIADKLSHRSASLLAAIEGSSCREPHLCPAVMQRIRLHEWIGPPCEAAQVALFLRYAKSAMKMPRLRRAALLPAPRLLTNRQANLIDRLGTSPTVDRRLSLGECSMLARLSCGIYFSDDNTSSGML